MKRTRSGLQNSHLFYDVDYVVYVEGGTLSRKEQDSGNHTGSLDVTFWKTLFEWFSGSTTYKFKARGSKTQLLPIADDVEAHDTPNIVVAMDRDFDFHTGRLRKHPRIIYTRGYSWENDVWDLDGLLRIIENVSVQTPLPETLCEEIRICIESFRRLARRIARVDVASTLAGDAPILKRDQVRRYLCAGKYHAPYCNRPEIRRRLTERRNSRTTPVRLPPGSATTGERDCFGHFLGCFGYHLLSYALKRQGISGQASQVFSSLTAIREFGTELGRGARSHVGTYYESVIRDAISG